MIVLGTFSFEFHAADTHANPLIKLLKQVDACREFRGKVVCRAANDLIQFLDYFRIQVMVASGYLPNLGLEFL